MILSFNDIFVIVWGDLISQLLTFFQEASSWLLLLTP